MAPWPRRADPTCSSTSDDPRETGLIEKCARPVGLADLFRERIDRRIGQ